MCVFVCSLPFFFNPPLFLFLFLFLEFINGVCELRWMWGNCSVLCRMYDHGKEVARE